MKVNTPNISTPLVVVKQQLNASQVHDFEQVSEALYWQKLRQSQEGLYSQDRFTAGGSNTESDVISPLTGKSQHCILWGINHYLGLNRDPYVIGQAQRAIGTYGTGCGTSALSGGMSDLHKEVENRIANLVGKERVLLFPTGYTTNLGVLSALPGKNDFFLFDRESHASIIDGIKLSGRKFASFRHNSLVDLEHKLEKYSATYENIIVVVESAYSMSGDLAPLREIVRLKERYKFYLYVDEAHTFGFYGKDGSGYCQELGIADRIDFLMSTLSKATASVGGFVACDAKYVPLLEWSANSYIFQACLPPGDAASILAALDRIASDPGLSQQLHEKNSYFRRQLTMLGFDLGTSRSPIVPIYIRDPQMLLEFNRELFEAGVFSVSIVYPAVKATEGRIRFIVNAAHSYDQIDRTVAVLKALGLKYRLIDSRSDRLIPLGTLGKVS